MSRILKSRYAHVSLIVFSSSLIGIFSAAAFQRFNGLFFYNLFLGSFASAVFCFLILTSLRFKVLLDGLHRVLMIVVSILISFSFLSTIPLTVDRSFSVWLLKTVEVTQKNNRIISSEELLERSVIFFGPNNGQLDRRLSEQGRLGNLRLERDGSVQLTEKGRFLAKFHSLIGAIFGLDPAYSRLTNN